MLAVAGLMVDLASLVGVYGSKDGHHIVCDKGGEEFGGGVGGGIVYDIGAVVDGIHDSAGLGRQIDLEANVVAGVGAGAETEGDDGEAVDKGLAGLAVVDEGDLALLVLHEVVGKLGDCFLVGELAGGGLFDSAVRGCLEEAAIAAEDVWLGVSGEVGEAGGDMDDGMVGLCGVDDDERGGHVDGAEGDLGVGPGGDAGKDIEHVEA